MQECCDERSNGTGRRCRRRRIDGGILAGAQWNGGNGRRASRGRAVQRQPGRRARAGLRRGRADGGAAAASGRGDAGDQVQRGRRRRDAASGGCRCSWATASRYRAATSPPILADAGRAAAEYLYWDTVTSLIDDGNGVDVTFERAAPRRFDLVVGADGLHSRVRELVFGTGFIQHMGLYVATVDLAGCGRRRADRPDPQHPRAGGRRPSGDRPGHRRVHLPEPRDCRASTTATRPGSAESSPRHTRAWGGGYPSCSNGCAWPTTCTSTRSAGSG